MVEKTRICPQCKQEVKIEIGLHNWKNLFRKPTLEELITLFIIIMAIALFFAWKHDIQQYQTYIQEHCSNVQAPGKLVKSDQPINNSILENVNITEENKTYQV